jgi:hypothetical protein
MTLVGGHRRAATMVGRDNTSLLGLTECLSVMFGDLTMTKCVKPLRHLAT